MTFFIFAAIIVCLAGLQMAIPYLVKKTIVFGVAIPEENLRDAHLVTYKRRYTLSILIFSLASLIGYTLWFYLQTPTEDLLALAGIMIQFGLIFLSTALYLFFHAQTKNRKHDNGWGADFKSVKVTDLSVRSKDVILPWYIFAIPMIVTVGVIVYTGFQYHLLPDQIPTHWGINGKPDAFTDKNPFTAVSMPLIMLVLQAMFLGINEGKRNSGIKLSASSLAASRNRQLTLRKNSSIFMFFTSVLITILSTFLQLTTIHEGLVGDTVMIAVPIVFLLLVFAGVILLAIKVGKSDKKLDEQAGGKIADYDQEEYWKLGLFYFNKNDPSIFVEKRFGVGWSLNFANPIGYAIVLIPLVVLILIGIFA